VPAGSAAWPGGGAQSTSSSAKTRDRAGIAGYLTDIRQIPGGFETTIAPLIGLCNGKSRPARAKGGRSWRLAGPER